MTFAIHGSQGFSKQDLQRAMADPEIRAEILAILTDEGGEPDDSQEYQDDSDRGCKDCPDDECTGHCMSCSYRSV